VNVVINEDEGNKLSNYKVFYKEKVSSALSNGICHTAFEQDQDELQFHPGPARKLSTNLYDIYHC
jgi:hypothetical protein